VAEEDSWFQFMDSGIGWIFNNNLATNAGVQASQATVAVASETVGDYNNVPDDDDLFQSKYDFTQRKFPSDLGEQSYNGHYMVININVQEGNRFSNEITTSDGKLKTFTMLNGQGQNGNAELSKTDVLRFNMDKKWFDSTGQSFGTDTRLLIPRQTRRIVESIALYMPNTVVYDMNNEYEDVGLTSIGTGLASGVLQGVSSFTGDNAVGKGLKGLSNMIDGGINGAMRASQMLQRPVNPRVEVLFKTTLQRTFQFDFLLAPSSGEETLAMHQIIKTLRFHAAPEYESSFGSFMYIPPSEFDITFFNRGKENLNIPRINTCALSKISVDYAPQGIYSTFTSGAPVSCRLQIEFKELETLTKLRIMQGF